MPSLLNDIDRQHLLAKDDQLTQQRMLRAIALALEALTTEIPQVLVLEDLHWSDWSTLEFISVVARRTELARFLILGTYRLAEMFTNHHPLRSMRQELDLHHYCEELRLKLLSEANVMAYLAKRFVNDKTARSLASVAPLIHERTEGNALFMVNVVDHLVQQGSLIDKNKIEAPRGILQMIEQNIER